MRAGRLAVVLCACLSWLGCASHADELRSSNQIPKAALANAVILRSVANAPLKVSYLDGDWKEIQISPGQSVTLPNSGGAVSVAYHDGAKIQSIQLAPGTQYVLYWDAQAARWSIGPYEAVMREGSGFRSR
ncbi:hypothetical protein JQ615_32060 [Bradyrhizobium jicamae]|uniref:Uncharacterized protein n=2 Tax=Bradyrhizobium jicamae TaxID=280332 RepID=A0ABS5FUP3_9BRAD|nr:hypothetical protein [Bradyrhizobium jicamae]MBR0800011.1 hypothetical protein [Bradyrhizobium jicamae]MBR0932055.1 hypothetical protein [Bradyrhizobium jicamae]